MTDILCISGKSFAGKWFSQIQEKCIFTTVERANVQVPSLLTRVLADNARRGQPNNDDDDGEDADADFDRDELDDVGDDSDDGHVEMESENPMEAALGRLRTRLRESPSIRYYSQQTGAASCGSQR